MTYDTAIKHTLTPGNLPIQGHILLQIYGNHKQEPQRYLLVGFGGVKVRLASFRAADRLGP